MRQGFQRQIPRQNKNGRTTKIVGLLLIVVVVIAGGAAIWRSRTSSKLAGQMDYQGNNPQTELGNESKRDDSASNTDTQNKVLTSQAVQPSNASVPKPTLMKSSGNNGPVPVGAIIEFTCLAPTGYNCSVELKGNKTITLDEKSIEDNRGQTGAGWEWTSEKGSWTIVAALKDSNGNTNSSDSQSLEVK